jgi:hypothetical protein
MPQTILISVQRLSFTGFSSLMPQNAVGAQALLAAPGTTAVIRANVADPRVTA